MKKMLLLLVLLMVVSLAFSWDLNRQAQFPTNFYALDRVGTTLYAAGYVGGFAKSIDNGATWTFLPSPAFDPVTPAYKDINDIDFYDEMHGVMVGGSGLVAVTADGGANWTVSASAAAIFGAETVNACYYMSDGQIWIAGTAGLIAYSIDNGTNFSAQNSGLSDTIYSISMNSSGVGFCGVNRGSPPQSKILTTTNGGGIWTIQNLTITNNPHIHKVRQYGSTVVLAGSNGYVGVSPDNGATWTHNSGAGGASTNMQDIILDGNNGYAVGWNGVMLKTTTGWTTFETVTNNFGLYFEGINLLSNGNLLVAGWNGSIAISADQGVTWTDQIADALDLFSGKAVNQNTWYFVGDKGYIIKTVDGGQNFTRLHIPNNFDIYYSCWFKNANEGWVSGKTGGKIFHTIDGGSNWTTFTIPGVTSTQIYYKIFFSSDLIGYAVGSNNINAKTVDGGLTWTMINGTGLGTSVLYSCFFKTDVLGFAGSSAGQLFVTQDGGLNWTGIVVGTATAQIRDIWFKNADMGVFVNSVGEIFHTSLGGLNAGDWAAGTESCLDDMNGVWADANGIFWASGYSSDNTTSNIGNSWSLVKSIDNGASWTQETFPALTFNSTRFMGMTGTAGKLVAYGKNNLIVSANNGNVEPPTVATNLFFSEYDEGSSNNKAIEIFNGTGGPVDLSQYSVKLAPNGGPWGTTLALTGTLANNDVYVIANASASAEILALADITSTVTYYNGNDALGLFQGTTQIDALGLPDQNPPTGVFWSVAGVTNALVDHTLIRKPTVISPTTDWALSAGTNIDDSEWIVQPINYITDLGVHTFTPQTGESAATPTFDPAAGIYTTPINVTMTSATPGATIYYTTDGTTPTTASNVYSTPVNVSATTTLKAFATAADLNDSFVASVVYTFPDMVVANIAALRSQTADNTTIYYLSGEVVMSFKQTNRYQKFVQDATAGILIDDAANVMNYNYNIGDGITGIAGKMNEFGGMLEFVPIINPGTPSTTGNIITPQVVTLSELTTNFEAYESELVIVMNCSFTGATGNFATGTVYPINDGTAPYNFRTNFYNTNYIGQAVPVAILNMVGLPNSRTDGDYLTSRSSADFQIAQGSVATPTFNPAGGINYGPVAVTISCTTAGAVIHYTLDGNTPTAASTVFTEPINITATTTVKAIAILDTMQSLVGIAVYAFPVEVANLAALRQQATGTTVYKVTGEVILTFKQVFRNQKWLQDNTAGVMIDDLGGIVTTAYNVGDGISGLTGTITEFGGMIEFVPVVNPAAATSTGNVITPQTVTMADFNANFDNYESELIQFTGVTFNTTATTFATGAVYPLTDGTNTINFRTTFFDVDYIPTTIPTGVISVIGIANSRVDGDYFTSRSLADFLQGTLEPPTLLTYQLDVYNVNLTWLPAEIPVPDNASRDWVNLTALKVYRNGAVIATITDFVDFQEAHYTDVNVAPGNYAYYVTNVYYGQFESAPSNTVNVNVVGNNDQHVTPATVTALTGNYPNPFSPSTTITYSVLDKAPVSLSIYNLKGEKVRTLVSATKSNGVYQTVWNGKNDSGKAVSGGVYFVRMVTGNYTATKRMLLLK